MTCQFGTLSGPAGYMSDSSGLAVAASNCTVGPGTGLDPGTGPAAEGRAVHIAARTSGGSTSSISHNYMIIKMHEKERRLTLEHLRTGRTCNTCSSSGPRSPGAGCIRYQIVDSLGTRIPADTLWPTPLWWVISRFLSPGLVTSLNSAFPWVSPLQYSFVMKVSRRNACGSSLPLFKSKYLEGDYI